MSALDQAILREIQTNQTKDVAQAFGDYVSAGLRQLTRHQQKWAKSAIMDVLHKAADISNPESTNELSE
jgi:hypothetical protein